METSKYFKYYYFKYFKDFKDFKYCSLIWMFCSRTINNKISKLHERTLRVLYGYCDSKFEEHLTKDSSFITHYQNIQTLAIDMLKIHMKISFVV